MTIKPVAAPPTQKRGVAAADVEQQDVGVGGVSGVGSGGVAGVGGVESSSNVVIDGHGQSPPQRRGDVFDDLPRHRRSPHKSSRSKRREHHHGDHAHHKRDRAVEREKHVSGAALAVSNVSSGGGGASGKCSSPHIHGGSSGGGGSSGAGVAAVANSALSTSSGSINNVGGNQSPASGVGVGVKSPPEHLAGITATSVSPKLQQTAHAVSQAAANLLKAVEETYSGYNSGDEHLQQAASSKKVGEEGVITADEWQRRDEQFAKSMTERGYVLKPVEEDGACLFRSISLQIYGDEEMHDVIRQHTMDYIFKNREYFGHFVTEDINSYIKRKRRKDSHGNHIEIQAMSEIYSRPVEVYCYKPTPINIFNSEQLNNGYAPLRLSYQRGSHYNAIIDPYNATVGVGLGLAGYKPELQTKEATRLSEQLEIEQTMFEDKLKTTDWEATNEAIEEQIARESYLQWCRENLHKTRATTTASNSAATSSSATVTSADATSASSASDAEASPSKYAIQRGGGGGSSTVTSAATLSGATAGAESASHEHALFSSSSKTYNLKKDTDAADLGGFDSDDTDMSSTSSIGAGGGGNASPTANAARGGAPAKKIHKLRGGIVAAVRGSKKRRRDLRNETATALGKSVAAKDPDVSARKSPKRDAPPLLQVKQQRAQTPDAEQQPCTSKQSSHTPEKQQQHQQLNKDDSSEKRSNTSAASVTKKSSSNFYQELLEASYAAADGQLTESEMLQRAIRMSTQDYIEDQKRKYLYGP